MSRCKDENNCGPIGSRELNRKSVSQKKFGGDRRKIVEDNVQRNIKSLENYTKKIEIKLTLIRFHFKAKLSFDASKVRSWGAL